VKIKTCADVFEGKYGSAATCLHVGQVDEAAERGEVVVLEIHVAHIPEVVDRNQIHGPELDAN
jgi:predicted dinucleotide-binding enzyme